MDLMSWTVVSGHLRSVCWWFSSRQYSIWRCRSSVLEHMFGLPGSCDFNMGDAQWEETCQLMQDSDNDFNWTMSQPSALPPLGPYVDHSPGQFSPWHLTIVVSFIVKHAATPSHLISSDREQTHSPTSARKSSCPCLPRWWWKIPLHRLRPSEGWWHRQGDNQEPVPCQRGPVSPALLVLHARLWQDGHAEGASVWVSTP